MSPADTTPNDGVMIAADGRVIGQRAQATRRRLLDSTAELLAHEGFFELKVVDITRSIGSAPATFYQYFADVDAAILALAEETTDAEAPLVELLSPAWTSTTDFDRARRFVDAYAEFWRHRHAILRVRNLKAEEGDPDFRAARSRSHLTLLKAMSEMISENQAAGRVSRLIDPFSAAAGLVAMLERTFSYLTEIRRRGPSQRAIRETMTAIVFATASGLAAPNELE